MCRNSSHTRMALGALLTAGALVFIARPAAAQNRQWARLGAPNSLFSYGQDINNAGTIIGFYGTDTSAVNFIKPKHGDFTPFDIPGAEGLTYFAGINSSGTSVGTWYTPEFSTRVFVRNANGSYRTLAPLRDLETSASRITDNGRIIGNVSAFDPDTFETLVQRGVSIDTLHGDAVSFFDYPDLPFTVLQAGNNHGFVAGIAFNEDFSVQIWFTADQGDYVPFEYSAGSLFGNLFDVNNQNDVLGVFVSPDFVVHGFIQAANGSFTTLEYPGLEALMAAEMPATFDDGGGGVLNRVDSATLTLPFGFDERGDAVGALGVGYADASGQVQFWAFAPDGFISRVGH